MMTAWNYFDLVLSIIAGVAVCIPLAAKLVQAVRTAAKSGHWNEIVSMVAELMAQAEELYSSGADRKKWVMNMLPAAAQSIDYDLTADEIAKISLMIDELCHMAKSVNSYAIEE